MARIVSGKTMALRGKRIVSGKTMALRGKRIVSGKTMAARAAAGALRGKRNVSAATMARRRPQSGGWNASRKRIRPNNMGHAGNFIPSIRLDTSQVRDMRVPRGTTMQLQQRRVIRLRPFVRR